jgi:hypothetical protein
VNVAEQPASSSRSYYRVETRLPVRLRRATLADVAAVEQRVAIGVEDGDVGAEPEAPAWARQLEHKLDRILALLDPSLPRPLDPRDVHRVVISGSGMRLAWDAGDLAPGDDVLVELLLPGEASGPVVAIAEVVGCGPSSGVAAEGVVSLHFRLLDERDRDAIVRLVYRVELAEKLRSRPQERRS